MKKKQKTCMLLCSMLLILVVTVGGTVAYLKSKTEQVINTFTEASVTTEVEESVNHNIKRDVRIKNTGTIDAYIRAAVVVTWQNEAGNVWGTEPEENIDYSISWNNTEWFKGSDGFYYHKKPVASSAYTSILFTDCKLKENVSAPQEGYYLNVEILASGIQAEPKSTVGFVWGVITDEIEDDDGNKVIIIKSK